MIPRIVKMLGVKTPAKVPRVPPAIAESGFSGTVDVPITSPYVTGCPNMTCQLEGRIAATCPPSLSPVRHRARHASPPGHSRVRSDSAAGG